jgi:hypothetical protein
MADIDDVLERLLTDADFAHRLASDPSGALAGYSLSQDDVTLLSTQVSFDPGALSLVEERISKAGMFGLLTSFTAGLGGLADVSPGQSADPHMAAGIIGPVDTHGIIIDTSVGDPDGVIGPSDSGETHGIIVIGGAGNPDGVVAPVDMEEVVAPVDSQGIVAPVDLKEVVAPVDSVGVIGPSDSEGVIGPSDSGETKGIIVIGGTQENTGGGTGGGGGGGEVSIKEVDPSPAPSVGGIVDPGDKVGFNPQPDPPGVGDKLAAKGIIIND